MTINWKFIGKAMGVYVALPAIAVFNGVIRDAVMLPVVGAYPAHVLGSITGVALLYLGMAFGLRVLQEPRDTPDLWILGGIWAGLTVGVEMLIFGVLLDMPIAQQLNAYKIWEGQLWPLVLLAVLVGPRLVGRRPKAPAA